jgi:GntR family transcriptional regulator
VTHHHLNAGPIPLYHQLSQLLRTAIEQGTYHPGDRLPSEPELIREYGVSRITVRQALDDLEAEGLVIRRHGTRALQLPAGTEVVRVDRVRLANDRPIAYDMTWLPLRFGELLVGVDLTKETIYQVLERRYAISILTGIFTITAAAATTQQAMHLETEGGAPLLVIQRLSCAARNEPVYFQERYYRPDRVQYRVALHRYQKTIGSSRIDEFRAIFEEQGLAANPSAPSSTT